MRDNEEGAAAMGVDITFSRILCFLGTAPFLGMAGAIITLQKLRIAPSASFSITDWTVFVVFNVVIGGIGSFEGADHRHDRLLRAPAMSRRARHLEPDPARHLFDHDHLNRKARPVGPLPSLPR
jgi:Branched-chain amino acid transport system / permease component